MEGVIALLLPGFVVLILLYFIQQLGDVMATIIAAFRDMFNGF